MCTPTLDPCKVGVNATKQVPRIRFRVCSVLFRELPRLLRVAGEESAVMASFFMTAGVDASRDSNLGFSFEVVSRVPYRAMVKAHLIFDICGANFKIICLLVAGND